MVRVADLLEQCVRAGRSTPFQGVAWNSRRNAGSVSGVGPVEQDREDRQALRVVVRPEVAVQRHLGLGPDPARHPVAADQHDEAAAAVHRLLQPAQPEIAGADALVVPEHRQPVPLELGAQVERRRPVVVAVAQEYVAAGHRAELTVNCLSLPA